MAQQQWNKRITRAEALLDGMTRRDYRTASEHFDTTMSSVMPAGKVEELWTAIQEQAGQFKERLGVRTEMVEDLPVVFMTCAFDNGQVDMRVVFDAHDNISGISFAPTAEPAEEAEEEASAGRPTGTQPVASA